MRGEDVFYEINDENVRELRKRYNKIRRWVIADFLRRSGRRYPEKTALIFNHPDGREIRLTYSELDKMANKVANALLNLGIKKYDRVAILAHNTLHHVLTIFGCAKAGAIYLGLNYLMYGKDLAYCINHSEAKVLIVEDALFERIEPAMDQLKTVDTFLWSNQGAGVEGEGRWESFDDFFDGESDTEPDTILNIEDPVQMTYTSGTESLPKCVVHTNESLIAQYVGCIVDGEYTANDIMFNTMPIYHCAQRDVFMMPIFYVGGTNVMMTEPNLDLMLEYIDRYRPTMLFLAPTVWIGLLRHPDIDKYDLQSLRKCYYGASIFPEEPLKELMKKLPQARFFQYYGQTELAPYHTVANHEEVLEYTKTAGRSGLNLESRLENDEHEEIAEIGVPGEITARGPHVMLMYYKDPEKTEEAFKCGWFHSGDIAVKYRESYFEIVDRKKDMIKTGGENVSSREVEEVIYKHPDVWEVAVIGLPHEKWIEAVTAIVVPKPGKTINPEEIIEFCRKELSPYKVPKGVIVLKPEDLPKTPSGKIMKRELRKIFKDYYSA
jgi:fatty-acyl-CoA synthase